MKRSSMRIVVFAPILLAVLMFALMVTATSSAQPLGYPVNGSRSCPNLLADSFRLLNAPQQGSLCERFSGKVLLIVNTASRCGYTYQYDGLTRLYQRYRDQGLVVVGFPSNDFAGQEPGSEQEIASFCRLTYGVDFPMMEKSHVKGAQANSLYLKLAQVSGHSPRWNFHKYLIGRNGDYIGQWNSEVEPESAEIITQIERALGS